MAGSMVSVYIYFHICYLKGQANVILISGYCGKKKKKKLIIRNLNAFVLTDRTQADFVFRRLEFESYRGHLLGM